MKDKDMGVTAGSGNVFEDLGFENAGEMRVKSSLAQAIASKIEQRKLTQSAAAHILGIDQPKVSNLIRGKLDDFSIARLMRFAILLGKDIEIVVKDHSNGNAHGEVKVACG